MQIEIAAEKLVFGSLFSGVGGLDLGLERAGLHCAWQVEIDTYCRSILARHWPHVARFEDVRDVGAHCLRRVDVLAGGFPCQDLSSAGKRAGITGARSGLWKEYARLISELEPRYVLIENVSALLHRNAGFGVVLEDLAACGFCAQWDVLPAAAFGAPHLRERAFVVAYRAEATDSGCPHDELHHRVFAGRGNLAEQHQPAGLSGWNGIRVDRSSRETLLRSATESLGAAPLACRLDDGISATLGALRGFGNAVVPQVAEHAAHCLLALDQALQDERQKQPLQLDLAA